MRVTVLGSAASHAGAGQACAGHLVEGGGSRVLFDCGNGVLANLYRVADPLTLDAVFVTHNHPDHYSDLYSMQAMLRYAPQGPLGALPLYLPEGLFERLQLLLSERGGTEFRAAFDARLLRENEPVTLHDLTVTPHEVDHTPPTFALCADADGAHFAYTADTAPGPRATAAVSCADFILAEATLPEAYAGMSPHLTARQAGELARGAGASGLALVHIWPTSDRAELAAQASEAFGAPVRVASEFDTFEIPPRKEV